MLEGQIKKISNILFSEEKIPILAVQIAHYLNILYEKPNKKVSQDYDDLKHNLKEWHDFFSQYTYFDYFKLNVKELTSEKKLNPEELENRISLFIKTIRKN
jgi:ASC-1-like (ASCH) protein